MRITSLVTLISIAFSGSAATAYVQTQNPGMLKDLLVSFDVLGISRASSGEKKRIDAITSLPIPYEQRDALKNRTVFLGATKEMVLLALGEPKTVNKNIHALKPNTQEAWIYYFEDDRRPTILFFSADKLTSAEKSSVIDLTQTN